MRTIRPAFLAAFLAVSLMLVPHTARAQDAKAEVTTAVEGFVLAFNARDAEKLTSFYTNASVVLPPGTEPVKGLEAIRGLWDTLDEAAPTMEFKIKDLMVAGDLVVETSSWSATAPDGSHADHGVYIAVWKNTDYGWKMVRDIWNSSMTP